MWGTTLLPGAHSQLVERRVMPLPRVLQPLHAQLQPAGAPLDAPPGLLPGGTARPPPLLPACMYRNEARDAVCVGRGALQW